MYLFLANEHSQHKSKLLQAVQDCRTITDFFKHIVDAVMVQKILLYTNKRIELAKVPNEPLNSDELYAFIGLLIRFGVTKRGDVHLAEIWSIDGCHHHALATVTMPLNRFKFILRFITFDDVLNRTQNEEKSGKFHKFKAIHDIFKLNIKSGYLPSKWLCIDEELYAFRGNCPFRQFIPSKPNKYGLKYWCLVDVETSYLLDTDIYTGKAKKEDANAKGVGLNVTLKLMEEYFGTFRHLCVDNFFSSMPLAARLWKESITFTGTLRKNKAEIPLSFLPSHTRPIQSSLFAFHDQYTLVSYVPKKNKAVVLLSTEHHTNEVNIEKGNKPKIIETYNSKKGGVDTFDHLVENFSCRRKTNRWPLNAFMLMIDGAAQNAFVMKKLFDNKEVNDPRLKRKTLEVLSEDLTKNLVEKRVDAAATNGYAGWTTKIKKTFEFAGIDLKPTEVIEATGETNSKRCHVCVTLKKENKSKKTCDSCKKPACGKHSIITCEKCCENLQKKSSF